jgi:ribose-phosphate pyrophosphokinase
MQIKSKVFFNIPVDNVYGSTVLIEDLLQRVKPEDNPIVVSPDVGGVVRARAIAKRVYDSDLAIIDKRRDRANESEVMNVLGDVNDKTCVIVDDMVDTAGTLCQAAFALKEAGAKKVLAYCTHPVLSGNAVKTITDSELDECVVANTISLSPEAEKCDKIRQLNLAGMLSEAIFRIHTSESLSSMFP